MSAKPTPSYRKRSADDMAPSSQPTIDQMFVKKPAKQAKKTPSPESTEPSQTRPKTFSKPQPSQQSPSTTHHRAPPDPATPRAGPTIKVTERTGDIFSAPPNTVIIHACNCQGSWSAGIAKAFKTHYPAAFHKYANHCKKWGEGDLLGTALLISPPTLTTTAATNSSTSVKGRGSGGKMNGDGAKGTAAGGSNAKGRHFVGCLFTSAHYGKRKGTPKQILEATGPAMGDLLRQIEAWNAEHPVKDKDGVGDDLRIKEIRMCKINSGLFNVPWEDTKAVIEKLEIEEREDGSRAMIEIEVFERE